MKYYVTAIAVPKGTTTAAELARVPRTDMAYFFERGHAEAHAEKLRGPHFHDVRIEERDE